MNFKITKEDCPTTLLRYLKEKLDQSNNEVRALLDKGRVRRNGVLERFGSKPLAIGDSIDLTSSKGEHQSIRFSKKHILFEDDHLLIYNKPAGLVLSPDEALAFFLPHLKSLHLVHRLDKGTTGALLIAKTKEMGEALKLLFKRHAIYKEYRALCLGRCTKKKGKIVSFLGKVGFYQGQSLWGSVGEKKGKEAITLFEVMETRRGVTLFKVIPKTGRTHQIRVHLMEMGFPILGDVQYAREALSSTPKDRVLLHASRIAFDHPITHLRIDIAVKLPDDMKLRTTT